MIKRALDTPPASKTVRYVLRHLSGMSWNRTLPPPPKRPGQKHFLARSCRVRLQPTSTRRLVGGRHRAVSKHQSTTRHDTSLTAEHRECTYGGSSAASLRVHNPMVAA